MALTVAGSSPGKQVIEFTGNVAQLRDAFHAQIHKYQVNGATPLCHRQRPRHSCRARPCRRWIRLPQQLPPEKPCSHSWARPAYDPKTGTAKPQWTINGGAGYPTIGGVNFALAPGDFGVQYDLPNPALNSHYTGTTYDGSGETIAIINDSNVNIDLVNQFRTLFGLPANPPNVVIDGNDPGIDGINNPDGPNYDSGEAYLDVEWSGAVAPKATVDLVIGADTALEAGFFLAAEHAVYSNLAPIISVSFGECEANLGSTNQFVEQSLWEQAAAQGITVMVSTGDDGSAGCDPDSAGVRPERRSRQRLCLHALRRRRRRHRFLLHQLRQPSPLRISPPTGTPPARTPRTFPCLPPSPNSPGTTASSASMP